jgi:hypothetical protein
VDGAEDLGLVVAEADGDGGGGEPDPEPVEASMQQGTRSQGQARESDWGRCRSRRYRG